MAAAPSDHDAGFGSSFGNGSTPPSPGSGSPGSAPDPVQATLEAGIRAARVGQNDAAQRLLQQVVAADASHELAWLWLSRVSPDPRDQAACLERAVALNPGNAWAAHGLAVLRGEADPAANPFAATQTGPLGGRRKKVGALNCPSCGGATELRCADSITVVCQFCHSVLDLSAEQAVAVGKLKAKGPRPSQPIKPGDEATFDGVHYLCVGWMRYKGHDDEDTWTWDEWLLLSDKGDSLWLSHDDEAGFELSERLPIDTPFDPANGDTIPVPGGKAKVSERESAALTALDGEFTWRAKKGDRMRYLDAAKGSVAYAVEWTDQEVELFRARSVPEPEVWTAFGNTALAAASAIAIKSEGRQRTTGNIGCGFIILTLGLALFTWFYPGTHIYEGYTHVPQGTVAVRLGPIEITEVDRPCNITFKCDSFPVDNFAEIDVAMELEATDTPGATASAPASTDGTAPAAAADSGVADVDIGTVGFWHEQGYDEGHWEESDYKGNLVFTPLTAGNYYVVLTMPETSGITDLGVAVDVRQGAMLARWYFIGAILMTIVMFLTAPPKINVQAIADHLED